MENEIRANAEKARAEYRMGLISLDEAKKMIKPYKEMFDIKSRELAKKYGVKPRYLSYVSYLR